jgi:hypothetical protein
MIGTVSLLTDPNKLEPINRELWFRVNSASYSATDFKYIFKVFYLEEPFESRPYKIGPMYKVPPRPDTGDGLFSPHKYIKSYISYNFNPWQEGFDSNIARAGGNVGIDDQLFKYTVMYGFEFNPSFNFTGTFNSGGFLGLSFSSAFGFLTNDLITINKDNKQINISYDGTSSITSVSGNGIVTDTPFGITFSGETGVITNIQRLTATATGEYWAFNGTRQYQEQDKDYGIYILETPTSKFLTTYPNEYKPILRDSTGGEYETISMIMRGPTGSRASINIYDVNGATAGGFSYVVTNTQRYRRADFGIGTMNIFDSSGFDFTDPNISTYTLQIVSATGSPLSEVKKYRIVDECTQYEKSRIAFLNRLGGFEYFTFTRDNKKTVNVKRNEYSKVLPWNWEYGKPEKKADRGSTVFAVEAEETFTLNSNWISESEAAWLEELMTSPEVYLLEYINGYSYNDTRGAVRTPIVITNTTYDVKTALRDRIFNITINYKLANPINLQND